MSFFDDVYELVKKVPRGKVTTYGDIAKTLGRPHSSRVVGYALHGNPDPDGIPCYRVVNRFGAVSKAFAFGGANMQTEMLRADGIEVNDGIVDLEKFGFTF